MGADKRRSPYIVAVRAGSATPPHLAASNANTNIDYARSVARIQYGKEKFAWGATASRLTSRFQLSMRDFAGKLNDVTSFQFVS